MFDWDDPSMSCALCALTATEWFQLTHFVKPSSMSIHWTDSTHKSYFYLWLTVYRMHTAWRMLKNCRHTFKKLLFGETTKQFLSNFEPWKSWKCKRLWRLGPDPSCFFKKEYCNRRISWYSYLCIYVCKPLLVLFEHFKIALPSTLIKSKFITAATELDVHEDWVFKDIPSWLAHVS